MQNFFEPADREPWRCATKYYRISWCVSAWPPSPASSACRNLTINLLSRAAVETKHCIRVCKRLTHCIRVRKRCGCTSSKWRHSSRYRDLVKHLAALNASAESAHEQERHWRTGCKKWISSCWGTCDILQDIASWLTILKTKYDFTWDFLRTY